jgi:hypothetical protein
MPVATTKSPIPLGIRLRRAPHAPLRVLDAFSHPSTPRSCRQPVSPSPYPAPTPQPDHAPDVTQNTPRKLPNDPVFDPYTLQLQHLLTCAPSITPSSLRQTASPSKPPTALTPQPDHVANRSQNTLPKAANDPILPPNVPHSHGPTHTRDLNNLRSRLTPFSLLPRQAVKASPDPTVNSKYLSQYLLIFTEKILLKSILCNETFHSWQPARLQRRLVRNSLDLKRRRSNEALLHSLTPGNPVGR